MLGAILAMLGIHRVERPQLKRFQAEEKPQVERDKDKDKRKKLKATRKKRGY